MGTMKLKPILGLSILLIFLFSLAAPGLAFELAEQNVVIEESTTETNPLLVEQEKEQVEETNPRLVEQEKEQVEETNPRLVEQEESVPREQPKEEVSAEELRKQERLIEQERVMGAKLLEEELKEQEENKKRELINANLKRVKQIEKPLISEEQMNKKEEGMKVASPMIKNKNLTDKVTKTPATGIIKKTESKTEDKSVSNKNLTKAKNSFPIASCKPSQGWKSGATYTLKNDLELPSGSNVWCLAPTADNVVIDCNGYKITSTNSAGGTRAIALKGRTGVTIKNCEIEGYTYGITLEKSPKNILQKNKVNANNYGIFLSDSDNNILSKNIAVNNKQYDFYCKGKSKGTTGTGNIFNKVKTCDSDGWPKITAYSAGVKGCGYTGWKKGETFKLYKDIELPKGTSVWCLAPSVDDVTIDCNGHKITNANTAGGSRAVSLKGRTGVTVKNCKIEGYTYGIVLENSGKNNLLNNVLSKNNYGVFLSDSSSNKVSKITAATNKQSDFYCKGKSTANGGNGNIFNTVTPCSDKWPVKNSDYSLGLYQCDLKMKWNAGDKYKLVNDLTLQNTPTTFCLAPDANNVIIDGNGFKFLNRNTAGGTRAISVKALSGVTVRNTNIEGYTYGIVLEKSNKNNLKSNILYQNQYGIAVSDSSSNVISINKAETNKQYDFYCMGNSKANSGTKNDFKKVKACVGGFPTSVKMKGSSNGIADLMFGDEKINMVMTLKNGSKKTVGVVIEGGKVKEVKNTAFKDAGVEIFGSADELEQITKSKEPTKDLKQAMDKGKAKSKAKGFGKKMKFAYAKTLAKITSLFN